MSQVAIREFDAKSMLFLYQEKKYSGLIIDKEEKKENIIELLSSLPYDTFVVKPDQLFGKRGKHDLVGMKLDTQGVQTWLNQHWMKEITIDGKTDTLHTFLIEEFIPHENEYYVSITTEKDYDIIRFSSQGGVDIDVDGNHIHTVQIGVLESCDDNTLSSLQAHIEDTEKDIIISFVKQLFLFFREYGFSYIEINPFVIRDNEVIPLDLVARVDSCEGYRQKDKWNHIQRVNAFGTHHDNSEKIVSDIDEKTGASLKLHILNPDGDIRLILGGGGASVIVMDTLAEKGMTNFVANYGELSGDPDRDSNREYAKIIIKQMLASKARNKYLVIIGGIANFTRIGKLFQGITDAIDIYHQEMEKQHIRVLVRRGGINDTEGLHIIRQCCQKYGLQLITMNDNYHLTDILGEISLS